MHGIWEPCSPCSEHLRSSRQPGVWSLSLAPVSWGVASRLECSAELSTIRSAGRVFPGPSQTPHLRPPHTGLGTGTQTPGEEQGGKKKTKDRGPESFTGTQDAGGDTQALHLPRDLGHVAWPFGGRRWAKWPPLDTVLSLCPHGHGAWKP